MNENLELLEYLYQNSEMGVYTLTRLLNELNEKENKIKKLVEDELKEYEKFLKETKSLIKKSKIEVKSNPLIAKMGASMGIKKEVSSDNSDASIAHMLVEGVTMGLVDIETKINNYKDSVDKKNIKLAEDYKRHLEKQIEGLREFM